MVKCYNHVIMFTFFLPFKSLITAINKENYIFIVPNNPIEIDIFPFTLLKRISWSTNDFFPII